MKAAVLTEVNKPFVFKSYSLDKEILNNMSKVEMQFSALNRRDYFISIGKYARIQTPIILGSDGSGLLDGRRVLFNPSMNWVGSENHQPNDYQILGMPQSGTFSEKILIQNSQIYDIPHHLTMEEGAALPLAGLTAYRVLVNKCKIQRGETVLITGAGGGVSTFLIQFCLAIGARVFVTSGNTDKISYFSNIGIEAGVLYTDDNWDKDLLRLSEGFDVIIDSAGGDGFGKLLKLAKPGGRIGVYGGTMGIVNNFSPQILFWKQLTVYGSTMGSRKDFEDMLDFVSKYKIHPIIDKIFDLSDINLAFQRMKNQQQIGKILLKNFK